MESLAFINNFFTCKICEGGVFPPLNGCINGHFVCHYCKSILDKDICPACSDEIKRQIGMERLLRDSNATVVCANNGCNVSTTHANGLLHAITCEFRPLLCLLSKGCRSEGLIPMHNFGNHITQKHHEYSIGKIMSPISKTIAMNFNVNDIKDGTTLYKRFDLNEEPHFLATLGHAAGYYTIWVISFSSIPNNGESIKRYTIEISPDSYLASNKTVIVKGLNVLSIHFHDPNLMEEYGKWAMVSKAFFHGNENFSIHIKMCF